MVPRTLPPGARLTLSRHQSGSLQRQLKLRVAQLDLALVLQECGIRLLPPDGIVLDLQLTRR
jgi:hypothetical protein